MGVLFKMPITILEDNNREKTEKNSAILESPEVPQDNSKGAFIPPALLKKRKREEQRKFIKKFGKIKIEEKVK